MKPLAHVASGVNVQALHWALMANPQLWNQNKLRTQDPASPHHGLDDIWIRYAKDNCATLGEFDCEWYESADILGVKPLVMDLFNKVGGVRLGGVLITRIPAGAECKPHTDTGGWHADYYEKFAIQIASAPGQKFCFEDVEFESKPGDVYWFNNSFKHWVPNPTPYERITMIVCVKR